jgi:threonine dehydrogenase-like Zn-dependent dehydrogenase
VLRDEPQPVPAAGEVLVRVHLAGICGTDLEILAGYGGHEGVLGHEFVGSVVSGSSALSGKRVVAEINCVCGRCDMCSSGLSNHCRRRTVLGINGRPGVFAEYVAVPERNCIEVPDSITDEEVVFTEPLAAAYQIIRQVKVESRMNVAVLGTGRLGLLAAQVLAQTNCRLSAIGRNPKTLGFLDRKRIRTSTVDEVRQLNDYDIVVDCTGSPEGLPLALRLVRPRGTILMKSTCAKDATADLMPLVVNEVTLLGSRCGPFGDALNALARKQVDVLSMISRRMPLAEGLEALALAADPEHIKVILEIAG